MSAPAQRSQRERRSTEKYKKYKEALDSGQLDTSPSEKSPSSTQSKSGAPEDTIVDMPPGTGTQQRARPTFLGQTDQSTVPAERNHVVDSKNASPETQGAKGMAAKRIADSDTNLAIGKHHGQRPAKRARTKSPERATAPSEQPRMVADRLGLMQPIYDKEDGPPSMDPMLLLAHSDFKAELEDFRSGRITQQRMDERRQFAQYNGVYVDGPRYSMVSFKESMEQAQRDMETSDEEGGEVDNDSDGTETYSLAQKFQRHGC